MEERMRNLLHRVEELSARLAEAEETLRAIRGGEVDALVVAAKDGERIFTLSGAERPYRILIEAMGEGAATLSRDGTILFANQAFAGIVGLPLERTVGASLHDILPPGDRHTLPAMLGSAAAESVRREAVLVTGLGGEIPVLLAATPLPGSDPPQVCVIVTDLSEPRKREAELARLNATLREEIRHRREAEKTVKQEHAFREAVEKSILVGLMATDLAGRIHSVNEAFCTMTGWSKEELLGTGPPYPFWPSEEIENLRKVFRAVMEGRIPPGGIEVRHMRRDGTRFDALLDASPLRDDRETVRGYVQTVYDVTYHKRMEVELARSEERFRTSIETMPDGIALLSAVRDPLGRVIDFRYDYVNETGCRLSGRAKEDLVGRTLLELHPAFRQTELFGVYRRVVETGEPLVKRALFCRSIPHVKFLDRIFDHRAVKFGDGLAASWHDVTDRVTAEKRRHAADRALALLRSAAGALARASDATEISRDICSVIVEAGGHRLAWAGFFADDTDRAIRPVAVWGSGGGYLDAAETTWFESEPGCSPAGRVLRTGSVQVVPDIAADSDLRPWREEAAGYGLSSCIALPLARGGRILGVLAVYSDRPNAFGTEEARLLADLAGILSFGAAAFRTRTSGYDDPRNPDRITAR
jgi:PAS domain S-box-containing protein